jgi:hypothetical protein
MSGQAPSGRGTRYAGRVEGVLNPKYCIGRRSI